MLLDYLNRNICLLLKAVIVAFVVTFLPTVSFSQYLWSTSHTDFSDGKYFCFYDLDCSGEICTAAALVIDTTAQLAKTEFFQSTDNGNTWKTQPSGLIPDSSITQGKAVFSRIRQIDKLNAIAIGNTSNSITFILRTTDGGNSWKRQDIKIKGKTIDVSFSDRQNGILLTQPDSTYGGTPCSGCASIYIYTTSDGGDVWDSLGASSPYVTNCFSFGKNLFGLFISGHGSLLSTTDNWKTHSTIGPFIIQPDDVNNKMILTNCNYIGSDTIIAYGKRLPNDGLIVRSSDRGLSWSKPQIFPTFGEVQTMTSLKRDTLLACGRAKKHILTSTDAGFSWREDSLLLDTNYSAYSATSIVWSGATPLAIFSFYNSFPDIPSIILKGKRLPNIVESTFNISYHDRIYPNPATNLVNIASIEQSTPFRIYNILGRVVYSGKVGNAEPVSVNTSSFPRGVYYVFVDNTRGIPILSGKLLLVAE